MTLVGKILTSVVAFVCVLLMAIVLALFSGHVNWKDKVINPNTGLKGQLEKARAERDEVKKRQEALANDLATEKKEETDRLNNLKAEVDLLAKERENLNGEKEKQEKTLVTAEESVEKTHKNCEEKRKKVADLQQTIVKTDGERAAHFQAMVDKTDELHQRINELSALSERARTLKQDLDKAKAVEAAESGRSGP